MKSKSYLILAPLFLSLSAPALAQQYMFTYSKLFSQMKSNTKEDHPDVKMGIFFVDAQSKQNCVIEKAWVAIFDHIKVCNCLTSITTNTFLQLIEIVLLSFGQLLSLRCHCLLS